MVSNQDVIMAAIDYEAAYSKEHDRVLVGQAHQRLLDTVHAYTTLQPEVMIIQPAIETNEARNAVKE